MRPLKIEFQAFGPYVGHELVDFEVLSSKGLFLICGNTGIGKTTILDAMTFALYGKSSGHGRDDFNAMRCTNAEPATPTFVRFEFENNGKYFLFERRLELKRKNYSPSYNLMERDGNGDWETVFENPKEKLLNDMAVKIIGLEYDQFRQVIVLPQGQFEKLLTSNSDEKEKILSNIFGEEKWQNIAEKLYEEVSGRRDLLKSKKDKLTNSLLEEGCESISELKSLIDEKNKELSKLKEDHEAAGYDEMIKAAREKLILAKRFADLHKAKAKVDKLISMEDEKKGWEIKIKDALRAEKVRTLVDDMKVSKDALLKRKAEEERAVKNARAAGLKEEEAKVLLKQHLERADGNENDKKLKLRYEEKRTSYESIDGLRTKLSMAQNELIKAGKELQKRKKADDILIKNIDGLRLKYEKLIKEHDSLIKAYVAGIKGELAAELVDGEPCPVCGSREHPQKAPVSSEGVTKEMVDAKKKEADRSYESYSNEVKKEEDAKKDLEEKREIHAKISGDIKVLETQCKSLEESLVEGIASLKELENEIKKTERRIVEYSFQKEKLEADAKLAGDIYTEAKARIEPALSEVKEADNKYRSALEKLNEGLLDNGFATEDEAVKLLLEEKDIEILRKRISEYEAELKHSAETLENLNEELKGKEEPDEAQCNKIIEDAGLEKDLYSKKQGALSNEIDRLDKKIKNIEKEADGMEEAIHQADQDFVFAKKIRGDSGTGLQRYVLGIMFSSVVAAANKMLEKVHGGRYRLYRSDDKAQGTNKRGLELKVFDKYSEDHSGRFVSTLSGGEKFLASLALSIGMSAIAQRSGIKIEALFIDEGFGSLDEDSIGDAMDVLSSIQEANGIVGIISHVGILEDRIPAKLRIERRGKGSCIVTAIG